MRGTATPNLCLAALAGALGVLSAACAVPPQVQEPGPARLQWLGHAEWHPVDRESMAAPAGATGAVVEWAVPATGAGNHNLAMMRPRATQCQLDDGGLLSAQRDWLSVPVPGDGQPHLFRCWYHGDPVTVDEGPRLAEGADAFLVTAQQDVGWLGTSAALLVLGLAMALLSLTARAPGPLRAAGGLAVGVGVLTLSQSSVGKSLIPLTPHGWRALHELSVPVAVWCVTVFVRQTLGDVRGVMLWLGRATLAAVALCVPLAVWWVPVLVRLRAPLFLLALAVIVTAVVVAVQRTRAGSRPARALLVGLAVVGLSVLPGMAEGLGLVNASGIELTHYGLLAFIGSMGWALSLMDRDNADELRARIAELERKEREVRGLNSELRRQVAERSRELASSVGKAAPVASRLPVEGDVFDGRYAVQRTLGRGGMGVVFEVRRLSDGRALALKLMTGSIDAEGAARFLREAELAARINDPHLVSVVDVGTTTTGTFFLVMELVSGRSLGELTEQWKDRRWALDVLTQTARGVAALHLEQVVHRDLKPANVLVAGTPRVPEVKVSDFGIARVLESGDPFGDTAHPVSGDGDTSRPGGSSAARTDAPDFTRTGATIGTPRYLPPEVVKNAKAATTGADIFSFGVMACEVLCGKYPFLLPPCLEVIGGRPPTEADTAFLGSSQLPSRLVEALIRSLSLKPEKRPSAAELVEALAEAYALQTAR